MIERKQFQPWCRKHRRHQQIAAISKLRLHTEETGAGNKSQLKAACTANFQLTVWVDYRCSALQLQTWMREMMGSGKMVCRMFMASESSSRTPFTMDCTQVASAFTLSWAEIRASSSPCFTGLLHHCQSLIMLCMLECIVHTSVCNVQSWLAS